MKGQRPPISLVTDPAENVTATGQAKWTMRRIVGNHAQRDEAFIAMEKLETFAAAAAVTAAAAAAAAVSTGHSRAIL